MQANTETFKLSAGVGNGDSMPVDRYTHKSIRVDPGGGSYTLQVTLDGTNWVTLGGAIASVTLLTTNDPTAPLPMTCKAMRMVTGAVGASPSAVLFGHDPV